MCSIDDRGKCVVTNVNSGHVLAEHSLPLSPSCDVASNVSDVISVSRTRAGVFASLLLDKSCVIVCVEDEVFILNFNKF